MNPMTSNDDAAMIRSYKLWPCWPALPLKRGNHDLDQKNLGVLLSTQEHVDVVTGKEGARLVVYHVYLFGMPKDKAGWDAAPKTEYDSVEALLADGWIVD